MTHTQITVNVTDLVTLFYRVYRLGVIDGETGYNTGSFDPSDNPHIINAGHAVLHAGQMDHDGSEFVQTTDIARVANAVVEVWPEGDQWQETNPSWK